MSEFDEIQKSSHYNQGEVECIKAIESAIVGLNPVDAFDTGQVVKYVWRWFFKGKGKDLEKARYYLNRLIDRYPKEPVPPFPPSQQRSEIDLRFVARRFQDFNKDL